MYSLLKQYYCNKYYKFLHFFKASLEKEPLTAGCKRLQDNILSNYKQHVGNFGALSAYWRNVYEKTNYYMYIHPGILFFRYRWLLGYIKGFRKISTIFR